MLPFESALEYASAECRRGSDYAPSPPLCPADIPMRDIPADIAQLTGS